MQDDTRGLMLWVQAPPEARIQIRAGGTRIEIPPEPVRGGQRFSLKVPPGANLLEVRVETEKGRARWSLPLVEQTTGEAQRPPAGDETDPNLLRRTRASARRLHALIKDRRFPDARKILDGLRRPPKAPAELRSVVAYYVGLLAEKEGDYRLALSEAEKVVEISERMKWEHELWQAEEQVALLLVGIGRYRDSGALLERLRRASKAKDDCEEGQLLTNLGWVELLAREAGEDVGDPLSAIEEGLTKYESCEEGPPEQRANTLLNLALAHLQERRLPQAKEALARARRILDHPPVYQRLWGLDLDGRIALLEGRPRAALGSFRQLEDLSLETSSFDGRLRADFGRAEAHRALDDPAGALEILQRAEELLDEQSLQVPVHQGRETFLAARQAVVSLHVELLLDRDREERALDVTRRARARLLRQLVHADRLAGLPPERRARWDRLLAEYQETREDLQRQAQDEWRLPSDRLLPDRAARRRQAETAEGLLDQAFLVLGEGNRAPPSSPPPVARPGELTLAYRPLSEGWVGFAADETGVAVHRFTLPPGELPRPEELSRYLLLPFRARIERAERLRILSSGRLEVVDFHALPFDGDVLLARLPVAYGLDLPVSAEWPGPPGRRALLVGDPRDDLPGAQDEIAAARRALETGSSPWTIEELSNSQASAAAVRRELATADLLHYAGHGTFSGFGGWGSSLLLAGPTQLTLGDLLALDRVPAWVILSACDTGRTSAATPVEGLGLAQAFLLAGSLEVVASTRPADDRTVPDFLAQIYRRWDREADFAAAFERAQLAWREQDPDADWASFRLFEP